MKKRVNRAFALCAITLSLLSLVASFGLLACSRPANCCSLNCESLCIDKELQIRQDYLDGFNLTQFTVEDVILSYIGTHSEWFVVILQVFTGAITGGPLPAVVTIAGYEFIFHAHISYLVWKDGQFYNWKFAYERGILSQSNISKIHYHFTKSYTN